MSSASSTPALTVPRKAGVVHTAHPYEQDPRGGLPYGHEAARALGVDQARVLKTLVVEIDRGGGHGGPVDLVVALVPVSTSLDLKALAATLEAKQASLAEPAAAERATGYVLGGISPPGQRRPLPTVVDSTAFDHETVLVSGGRRGLDIELRAGDLVAITGARTAPIHRWTAGSEFGTAGRAGTDPASSAARTGRGRYGRFTAADHRARLCTDDDGHGGC